MNAANMPQPYSPVQSRSPNRILFVRQRFSSFGGGELILDRIMAALEERRTAVALLGRSWTGGRAVEFIPCAPPRFPRFLRERNFARAACARIAREDGALVQSHERLPCCDLYRAGDGVHAAFVEHRKRGMSAVAARALSLHPFHRSVMALERELFASPRLQAVIANSRMVADEIVRHFGFAREKIHLVPNGIDLTRMPVEVAPIAHYHMGGVRVNQGDYVFGDEDGIVTVTPPTWRPDLTDAPTLVEEVARIDGYDRIPSVVPRAIGGRGLTHDQRSRRAVAAGLAGLGLHEVLTYPFIGEARFDELGLTEDDPRRSALRLANPLSDEAPLMRTELLQTLPEALRRNISRGARDVALFEIE